MIVLKLDVRSYIHLKTIALQQGILVVLRVERRSCWQLLTYTDKHPNKNWRSYQPTSVLIRSPGKPVWPSGLRRWRKAPVRKGVGSNPTAVTSPVAVAPPRADTTLDHRQVGYELSRQMRLGTQTCNQHAWLLVRDLWPKTKEGK